MSDKSTALRAFNAHFDEFVNDILSVFPENTDIRSAKNIVLMARKANVTIIIKLWFTSIYSPYKDKIDNGDLEFFINKDYSQDLNGVSNSNDILSSIDALRKPIAQMSEVNKEHSLKYIQNLCKLSQLYSQF